MKNLVDRITKLLERVGLPTDNQSIYAYITSSYKLNKAEKAELKELLSL